MKQNNDLDKICSHIPISSMDSICHGPFNSEIVTKNGSFISNNCDVALHSLWDLLPKNIIDLIFAYDATFYDYMNINILKTRPLYLFPTVLEHSFQFYGSIMANRYHNNHICDLLQILNLKSIYTEYQVFPIKEDLKRIVDYRMRLHGVDLHKVIFKFENKLHWYVCIEPHSSLNIIAFLKKFLFTKNIRMSQDSRISVFRKMENIVALTYFDKKDAAKCLKLNVHSVAKINITNFRILLDKPMFNCRIEHLQIMSFNNRIFLELIPEINLENENIYSFNKWKYNIVIYYLNYCLKSVCYL